MFSNEKQFKEYISKIEIDDQPRHSHRQKLWKQIQNSFDSKKSQTIIPEKLTRFINIKTAALAAAVIISLALTAIIFINTSGKDLTDRDTFADDHQNTGSVSPDTETGPDLDIVKNLYIAKDLPGLIDILKTGSSPQKLLAAHYLSLIGNESALNALNLAAKNTDIPSAQKIFTKAAETIQNRIGQNPNPDEPNIPENIQSLAPRIPTEPNNPSKQEITIPENAMKLSITQEQTNLPLPDVLIKTNIDNKKSQYNTDQKGIAYIDLGENKINYMSLTFSKPSYVPMQISWRKNMGDTIPQHFNVKLKKGTKIGGTVLNEAHEPIEGATVYLRANADQKPGQLNIRIDDHPVKTDSKGKWVCDILPQDPAQYNLAIKFTHPDYADDPTYRWQGSLPGFEKLYDMTAVFYMKKGFDVTGYVYDQNGDPIPKASLLTGDSRYSQEPKTATDKDGKFIFKNSQSRLVILTVQAKGFAPQIAQFHAAPDNCNIDFYLEPGYTIKGRVIDTDGKPIPGVHFNPDEWQGFRTINHRGITDKNGEFIWDQAPPDEVLMDFYKQGYMSEREVPMSPSQDIYEVVMYPQLNISGTVTDAETKKPIKNFTITKGIKWNNNDNIYWQHGYGNVMDFKDGSYSITFSYPYPGHALKIEAKGFLTDQSDIFDSYEGNVKFDFQLEKGSFQFEALVLLPDGSTPAKNAKVYLPTSSASLQIQNGYVRHSAGTSNFQTNQKGIFTLNLPSRNCLIVALHEKGFAWIQEDHFEQDPVIVLEKWGKVKGTLYVGNKPGINENIKLYPDLQWTHLPDKPRFHAFYETVTDQNGEFILNRIIPGPAKISRIKIIDMGTLRKHIPLLSKNIKVLPGRTAEVVIGGNGIAIEGRLLSPAGFDDLDWTMADASISTKVDLTVSDYSQTQWPLPEDYDSMTFEQVMQWYKEWNQSPEGKQFIEKINKNYRRDTNKERKHFSVPIEHDGSFHIDDIPPGEYLFDVKVYAREVRGHRDYRNIIAKLNFDLTVPEYTSENDEILDLGNCQLIDPKTDVLKTGDQAPALNEKTLSGKTFSLKSRRGKYILLYLWLLRYDDDGGNIHQTLKQIAETCQKYSVECAGLHVTPAWGISKKLLNKYLDQYDINTEQVMITHQQARQWTSSRIPYTGYYLIDPDGIIIAAGRELSDVPGLINETFEYPK